VRVGLPRSSVEYDRDVWRGCVKDVGRCSERVVTKALNSGLALIFNGTSSRIDVNISLWFTMLCAIDQEVSTGKKTNENSRLGTEWSFPVGLEELF